MATLEINAIFDTLEHNFEDMPEAFQKVHQYMVVRTDISFQNEGGRGVEWDEFSENTKSRPSGRKVTGSSKLLQDTLTMRRRAARTIEKLTDEELGFGVRLNYASKQQDGESGSVRVDPHQRLITQAFGRKLKFPVIANVKAHNKQANLPARPFLFWEKGVDDEEASLIIMDHLLSKIPEVIELFIGGK